MKIHFFTLSALTAAIMLATSCGNAGKTDTKDSQSRDINNFIIEETFKTASSCYKCVGDTTFGADTEVFTTSSVSVQWPEKFGDNNLKSLQDSLLASVFDSAPVSIDEAIGTFLAHPIGYGDCELQRIDSVPDASASVRVLSQNIRCHTVGFCEHYIVYKIEADEYRGGAHPSYSAKFLNYDVKRNNVLDFNEIFAEDSDSIILDVIKASLCDMYYADSLTELAEKSGIFTDRIFLTHNVYLTGNNIVFYYIPYDIAPWAVGPIEVVVPYYNLEQYLTDEAQDLFKY